MRDNDMFILLRENLLKEYQLRSSVIPAVQKAFQPEPQGIPRTAWKPAAHPVSVLPVMRRELAMTMLVMVVKL